MKTYWIIGLFTWDPNSEHEFYYQYLSDYFYSKWIQIVRLTMKKYDIRDKKFKEYRIRDKLSETYNLIQKEITPDLCYYTRNSITHRLLDLSHNCKMLNNLLLTEIAIDKYVQYGLFEEHFGYTKTFAQINSEPEEYLSKFQTEEVIIKPRDWTFWQWIKKILKNNILDEIANYKSHSYSESLKLRDMIVQEFVDSSAGIPGIVKWIHDIRAIIFGDKIWYYCVRSASGDNFLCNVHQWSKTQNIPTSKMPVEYTDKVQEIVSKMNNLIYSTDCIYSIDFFVDRDWNFKLIELNSNPWLIMIKDDLEFRQIYADNLLGIIQNKLEI